MNVMLTRLPDGTVNAEPGDAVEYFEDGEWRLADFHGYTGKFNDVARLIDAENDKAIYFKGYIRHARGGAGHLRLQVARLRAFIEKEFGATERFEELTEGDYKRGVNAMAHINKVAAENALVDIDSYQFEEPQP